MAMLGSTRRTGIKQSPILRRTQPGTLPSAALAVMACQRSLSPTGRPPDRTAPRRGDKNGRADITYAACDKHEWDGLTKNLLALHAFRNLYDRFNWTDWLLL
jgi:hypothetical protein